MAHVQWCLEFAAAVGVAALFGIAVGVWGATKIASVIVDDMFRRRGQ